MRAASSDGSLGVAAGAPMREAVLQPTRSEVGDSGALPRGGAGLGLRGALLGGGWTACRRRIASAWSESSASYERESSLRCGKTAPRWPWCEAARDTAPGAACEARMPWQETRGAGRAGGRWGRPQPIAAPGRRQGPEGVIAPAAVPLLLGGLGAGGGRADCGEGVRALACRRPARLTAVPAWRLLHPVRGGCKGT